MDCKGALMKLYKNATLIENVKSCNFVLTTKTLEYIIGGNPKTRIKFDSYQIEEGGDLVFKVGEETYNLKFKHE